MIFKLFKEEIFAEVLNSVFKQIVKVKMIVTTNLPKLPNFIP